MTRGNDYDGGITSFPTFLASIPEAAGPMAAGWVAFGSTLALSTFCQMSILGISTGSVRPIPTVAGVVSVALASVASHHASLQTYRYFHDMPLRLPSSQRRRSSNSSGQSVRRRYSSRRGQGGPGEMISNALDDVSFGQDGLRFRGYGISMHTLRICAIGLVAFKVLGGRFWGVSPSSYTHLGSFARFSIPAGDGYATAAERAILEKIGDRWGCHTCGSKMWFREGIRFHGDHVPPRAVADQMNKRMWRKVLGIKTKFRFYPQCVDCSNVQGKILGQATRRLRDLNQNVNLAFAGGGRLSCFHGFRTRLNHLAGGVVSASTILGATRKDVEDEGRSRLQSFQERLENGLLRYAPGRRRW